MTEGCGKSTGKLSRVGGYRERQGFVGLKGVEKGLETSVGFCEVLSGAQRATESGSQFR